MEITINNIKAYESRKEVIKAIWQLHYKESSKIILLQYLIGFTLFTIGVLTNKGYAMIRTNSILSENTTNTYFNLHLLISIGIVYILFTTFSFLNLLRSKRPYLNKYEVETKKYYQYSNEMTLTINDEGINHNHLLSKFDIKWAAFSHFKLYNDILFISNNNSFTSAISIHKTQVTDEQFSELLLFVTGRLVPMTKL